jgi:hypothetical protein
MKEGSRVLSSLGSPPLRVEPALGVPQVSSPYAGLDQGRWWMRQVASTSTWARARTARPSERVAGR